MLRIISSNISGVTVNAVSTQLLPANKDRKFLSIGNISNERIDLAFAVDAELEKGFSIFPGSTIVFQAEGQAQDDCLPCVVNGICSSGNKKVTILEA